MDIETNMEQMADQQDAFLDGWDDFADQQSESEAEETVEQTEEPAVTEETTEVTQEQTEVTAEETAEPAAGKEEIPAAAEWIIKHMGAEQKLTAADITPELLQKGKDYDRVRAKYDEAKPVMELFSAFAAKANMSVADYAKTLRAEVKKAEGMSDAEASRAIELEDREAAVAIAEAAQKEAEKEKTDAQAKVQADLDLFGKLYPDVYNKAKSDFAVIPQSVWDAVNKGESFVVAYKNYADAQAKAEREQLLARANAAEQGAKNAVRSTGSMKSAGNDTKNTDPFLEGW